MLLGEFQCAADRGGRLTIPSKLRTELGEGLTLTRGIERCLFAYPTDEWKKLADKIKHRLPLTNRDARAFGRLMFSAALTCTPDSEGQIPLPENLRQYAGIEESAVVIGVGTHLEIWNPQRWQEVRERTVEEGTAIVERLSEMGV
jgi:MraZ protein